MPAVSKAQRALMAIAEHHPEQVSAKNKGVLKMSKSQLHDYASTKAKPLLERVRVPKVAKKVSKAKFIGFHRKAAIGI